MPFGGTSPEQDKKIDECLGNISGTNKRTGKAYTESEKIAICKSQIMGKAWLFSEAVEVKSENDEYFVEGVISTTSPDLGNDIVSEKALSQIANTINNASDEGKPLSVGYEHTELLGGHPNLVPLGHFVKAWIEGGKLFAKATLNKALSIFNEVKTALERKDLHSFSIEYIPGDVQYTLVNGLKHRIINTFKALAGAALTGRPMNGEAMITAVSAKNLDFAKIGYPVNFKGEHEIHEETHKEEAMTDEEKKKKAMKDKEQHMEEKKMETETVQTKKFEVSQEQYEQLTELKNRQDEEKTNGKMKEVALKLIQEEMAKATSSTGPSFGSTQKFDTASQTQQPEAVKDWVASVEGKGVSANQKWKAAAKLHNYFEAKGRSPTAPEKTSLNNWSMKIGGDERGFEMKSAYEYKAQIEHDTNRTTTGTEYFLAGPDLNDIYNPAIVSHLNERHTTYNLLRKVDGSGYGDTYGFKFKYGRNTDTVQYDESGTDNPTAAVTNRKKAHIPFMWYRKVGQVSGPAITAASGRGGIGDVYSEEVKDQTEALLQAINVDIFDSSTPSAGMTRGGQILSLAYLVEDGTTNTTLYAHTRTSGNFTTLQGSLTAKTGSPNPSKDDLRTLWTTSEANGAEHNDLVFVTSFTQIRKLMGMLDDGQRYMGTNANAGFTGQFSFDGIPVFADATTDAGYIYLLDTRYTYLVVQLPPTIEELAKLGDYRKFQIKTYFLLVGEAPNHNGLMTGFNTS